MVAEIKFGFSIIILFVIIKAITNVVIAENCGGHLTSQKGIINTPNFPNIFNVPIKCHWIIDASNLPFGNGSIIVYLTQLYVNKGLKFTEYAYYESETTNFGETVIKEITESNIFEYRWIKTYRPFLVIEFLLERLEGNHVRILHDLLDVYGFNMTYEVTENEANENSCTVRDCSFTGDCILDDDFSEFSCRCFDDFRGEKCSIGPLCMGDNKNDICRNGGTCRHIGAEAVRCQCPPDFAGDHCEIPLINDNNSDCGGSNCILQCSFDGKDRRPCNCKDPIKIHNNRSRYEFRIKLTNSTNGLKSQAGSMENLLRKQLAKHLRNSNIGSIEDLKILSITPTSEVTFNFFGTSNDGDKIRESLNRLVQRKRLNDFTFESTYFTFQKKPSLRLQSLDVVGREVRLGNEFVLSCTAQGSDGLKFTWYKDNMLINMSKTYREIWYKNMPNDGSDIYSSILTIEKATLLDSGQYTCQAIDWGSQQCKSIYIDVKVVPRTATIEKGNDLQLLCITPNMKSLGIGFGWTKNRALVKLEPGSQVWEDLYPAGSILKIINAQKSAIYTCNVAHKSMSVRVEVVNKTMIPICTNEISWGLRWPDTGPGTESLLDCPQHFVGSHVSRLCSMKDATTSVWQIPDFSECLYQQFISPYTNFQSLTLGYQNTTGSETIIAFWEVLRSRKLSLYPGEGDRILSILIEIEEYQNSIGELYDLYDSADSMIKIINKILSDRNSIFINNKQSILQQLTQRNLEYLAKKLPDSHKHIALSSTVIDIHSFNQTNNDELLYQLPADAYMYPHWYNDKITIRQLQSSMNKDKTMNLMVIVYKNITQFMPTTFVKELEDGTDLEYHFNSHVVTIMIDKITKNNIQIELIMKNINNITSSWNISCGIVDNYGIWNLDYCKTIIIPEDGTTKCICHSYGTFAVFLKSRAVRVILAKIEKTTFLILLGCFLCLIQCTITLLIIIGYIIKYRTWLNFLKLQCSVAFIGAMILFIYSIYFKITDKQQYSIIAVFLETFLLIGMSSPISQALIIYADLTQLKLGKNFQPTVISVITGLPIICILITELSHKSTGWTHNSWWLIFGSGVYNIFISCVLTMLSIFILIYTGGYVKAHLLIKQNIIKKEIIKKKIKILDQSGLILTCLIIVIGSSIFYINSDNIIWHYIFSTFTIILGFINLIIFIGKNEILFIAPILQRFTNNSNGDDDNNENIKTDTNKICSKKDIDNDCGQQGILLNLPGYMETRGIAIGGIDVRNCVNQLPGTYVNTSLIQQPPAPLPPPTSSSTSTLSNRYLKDKNDDINLDNYNSTIDSGTTLARPSNCGQEFYNVTSRSNSNNWDHTVFVGSREVQTCNSSMLQAECSAVVLCSVDVESRMGINSMPDVTLATKNEIELLNKIEVKRDHVNIIPDIATTGERKQPDGEEKNPEITITDCETTGMLDAISHDLDYLLNRTDET
ncbi:uncharacterized protein LOC122855196 isoform X2 [Aphidius gifuensis]|uniref:uncharacterized protein LOC122855196 isoform X2 n=1 Tax=Aphidius gifuensis TaxID=684658 RepID=UPI001CDD8BAB|nr:uncharacterized protein LOC122855196 isoform X2 [Aphidius gifuensis]